MKVAILDSSVLWYWIKADESEQSKHALLLREEHYSGELAVVVPRLVFTELLNIGARAYHLTDRYMDELAEHLENLAFDVKDPPLRDVAMWAASGLTAYDATYVALAVETGLPLITDDREILRKIPHSAIPLIPSGP
ncbi:MAG: type II toxin-antitoxin system VapC family toxin [Dehalococcoidia bacterium]